jgi:L-ascorbate metabolism protein UlaG (beta-lactamase superfamily)
MIEPVQSGQALLDDIQQTLPAPGQVALWWLGQSGYAIKSAQHLLYMDLYLSEHLTAKYAQTEKPHIRMTRSPLHGQEIQNARYVLASHKHSDHLDPGTLPDLFRASPQARLILPLALVDYAVHLGLESERLQPLRGEDALPLDGLTIHAIPSAHPGLDYNPQTGYPFLGFILQFEGGPTLYHSGDTLAYEGLAERLQVFRPDIVLLPINGTSPRLAQLGVPPNMNSQEAIQLAQAVQAQCLIPHHYDMFTFNTVDVSLFEAQAQAAGQPYQVLQCGQQWRWPT